MKERNIILEGKLKSWLLSVDIEKLAAKQQGQLILGLEKLYQATGDADYHTFAKKAVDNLVAEDGTYAKAEGSLSDNLFGNALFAVRAMDTVYNPQDTAAEKTEKAILKQEKVMTSGARFDATETCAGTFSTKLSDAYLTQPFYMNYETKFGGKEQYNDIIAQFNILQEKAYPSVKNELGNAAADLEMAAYAAAAVDTMEVMEQPLYEIFDRLRQILKQAVSAMNDKSLEAFAKETKEVQEAGLFYAYAVLKGCRMKALITEKYEKAALDILEAAEAKAQEDDVFGADTAYTAVLVTAYAESLRNREYQDYGRTKGGALWS